jgi:hypothetical protein
MELGVSQKWEDYSLLGCNAMLVDCTNDSKNQVPTSFRFFCHENGSSIFL